MLFEADITIPANTAKEDATEVKLAVASGIITKIMVRPSIGHASLAHLIILHRESQIAPSSENMDLHGDYFPIDWEEYYELYQPPFHLKLRGWNDDDTFEHTFTVYIAILPRRAILPLAVSDAIKSTLNRLSPKRLFTGGV